jgi:RNA polymerase-binding protein DksA
MPTALGALVVLGIHPAVALSMNYETLEVFRRWLLERRLSLSERRAHALAAEQQLRAEHEPDWEDAAAVESASSLLNNLSEADRYAMARINASLERIEQGRYGECAVCGDAIDPERLRAVPETDRCGHCALAGTNS